jgi:SnoaL-like domain
MSEYRDLSPTEIADVLEIHDVFARYAYLMDTKRLDEWLELFSSDCRYVVHGREYERREGVREMVGLAAPEGTHMVAAPTIRVDGEHATAAQTFIAISADKKSFRSGWYEDELAKVDGRWLISVRACSFVRSDGSIRPAK